MKFLAHLPASTAHILRRMLRVFVPAALIIGVSAYFICQTEAQRQHAERAGREQVAIRAGTVSINRTLQQVGRDLIYLTGRFHSRNMIDAPDEERLRRTATDWVIFSQANQVYNKLRWLDEKGMERLRVDYAESMPKVVAETALQFKGDRYFFTETSRLKPNEIFVSPLDLNVDNNRIEVPHHPNIRFGMPLFDSSGNRRGIILINYSAHSLLGRFKNETSARNDRQWLLNQDGYWLKGSDGADEFGFMFGRDDLTMARRYPQAWKKIQDAEKGQFESEDGLWTFATVYPLQDWSHQDVQAGSDVSIVTAKVAANSKYTWKAVSLLPASDYDAGLLPFQLQIGAGAFLLLLLFCTVSGRLIYVSAVRERIQGELNVATDIQASLLPRIFPPFPHRPEFDIFASMDPAKEVGGDFYDFFLIDETRLCFLVADVSDKGVPAALYMMVAKTLLKSEGQRLGDPALILNSVNGILANSNDNCMFTTVLCAILDTASGEVTIANAGHNPPLIMDTEGVRYLRLKAGLVLGPMPDVTYVNQRTILQPGDALFFYTDGVTEAQNHDGLLYGEAALQQALEQCSRDDPEAAIHHVRAQVVRHAHGAPQSDDVTMLMLVYRGAASGNEMNGIVS